MNTVCRRGERKVRDAGDGKWIMEDETYRDDAFKTSIQFVDVLEDGFHALLLWMC